VLLEARTTFRATTRQALPVAAVPSLRGATVPVRVNPSNHEQVAIDLSDRARDAITPHAEPHVEVHAAPIADGEVELEIRGEPQRKRRGGFMFPWGRKRTRRID